MGRQTKIDIVQRFKPFSHEAGSCCLIPFTDWLVTAFPTRLEIFDFFGETVIIELELIGPVEGFTLEQDLEKGLCRIFGSAVDGYFELHLFLDQKERSLALKYARGKGVTLYIDGKKIRLLKGEGIDLMNATFDEKYFEGRERISLGSHKKQDVSFIWQRNDLKELLPLLYFLSQSVLLPADEKLHHLPMTTSGFLTFLQTGFKSMFVPKRKDDRFLGVFSEELSESTTPLHRLKAFKKAFRSLFIREEKGKISLIPNLPKEFASGRMVGAKVKGGTIDFEWRKGKLRTVIFRAKSDAKFSVIWPSEIQSFRVDKKRGIQKKQSLFELKKSDKLLLDKFQR